MEKRDDGGTAFPSMAKTAKSAFAFPIESLDMPLAGQDDLQYRGMTLRQWYKGMALMGLCQQVGDNYSSGACNSKLVERASVIADHCIAEDKEAKR